MLKKVLTVTTVLVASIAFNCHAESPKGVRSLDYQEIEKGFFTELDIGPMMGVTGFSEKSGLKMGFLTTIGIGYDIIDALSIDAGVSIYHWSSGSPTECTIGEDKGCCPSCDNPYATGQVVTPSPSDLFGVAPRASLKFSFVSTHRTYFFIRAGGGMMLAKPDDIHVGSENKEETLDCEAICEKEEETVSSEEEEKEEETMGGSVPMVEGSLGVEYYSGLRHLSIGIETKVVVLLPSSGAVISVGVAPTLKYTF